MKEMDMLSKIIAYEQGEFDDVEVLAFFQNPELA